MSDGGTGPAERRERLRKAWAYFGLWREFRPFWGGTLLLLAGLAMGFIPVVAAGLLPFAVGSFTGSALLFAALLLVCGLSALTFPRVSSVVGIAGMLVSVLSVFGALGGYLVGSFLGGVGGLLAFAWRPPTIEEIEAEYGTADDASFDGADDGTDACGGGTGTTNAAEE